MAKGGKIKGKEKEKEKEKVTPKPEEPPKKDLLPPAPSIAHVPISQPVHAHAVQELSPVQEERDVDIAEMDILKSRDELATGWSGSGNNEWGEGGGETWSGGNYDDGEKRDDAEYNWQSSPEDGRKSPSQASTYPHHQNHQLPPAPPSSPPPLPTPPPGAAYVGVSAVDHAMKNPANNGVNLGGHYQSAEQQQGTQLQTQHSQPSSFSRASLAAAAMNRGVGSKGAPGHDQHGADRGPFWRGPQNVPEMQKSGLRSALKASGVVSQPQVNTGWGQPKNTDPWGVPKPVTSQVEDSRTRYHSGHHGGHRAPAPAWQSWGKTPEPWNKTYEDDQDDDDDDETSEETVGGWDASNSWDVHQRPDERGWAQEGKKQSKVTFASSSSGETKNVVSPQQYSQTLNSLLNLPSQNPNAMTGQHGHLPAHYAQYQKQMQYHPHGHPSKHKHEHIHQASYFPQQHQQLNRQYQDPNGKKNKKEKQKEKHKRKQEQSNTWGNDDWSGQGGNDNAWGTGDTGGDDSWRNDGWDEKNNGWGNTDRDKGGWGNEDEDEDGWDGGGNDDWDQSKDPWSTGGSKDAWGQAGNGNDAWNQTNHNKSTWGNEGEGNNQWEHSGGGGKKGRDKSGWGAAEDNKDSWENPRRMQNSVWSSSQVETPYTMPSKTLAHAYKGTTTQLNIGVPRNKMNEYMDVHFIESHGEALKPVQNAIFGRKFRMAKDRIHWMFSPNKDERVSSLLAWIQAMEYNLGAFGLHKFLQSRERGALFANADFQPETEPNQPAFDWLTFDQLQPTMDRTLQESVAFYDPAVQVIVFVFLPSKSGNSVAIWRRKVNVPNNARLMLQKEIGLAMAGLRRQKDYAIWVDELPPKKPGGSSRHNRHKSLPANPQEKKKKRKWWQFLRFET